MARPKNGPWYRPDRDRWYWTDRDGKQRPLNVRGAGGREAALLEWVEVSRTATPQPRPQPRKAGLDRFEDLLSAWLADAASKRKPSTVAGYRALVRTAALIWGGCRVDAITSARLEAGVSQPGWGITYRGNLLRVVKAAIRWGVRTGKIDSDPAPDLRVPQPGIRQHGCGLTREQLAGLLEVCPPDLGDLLRFLHATGARPSEAVAVTCQQVDRSRLAVVLTDHKTRIRTDKPRYLRFPASMLPMIERRIGQRSAGLLFLSCRGRPWSAFNLCARFARWRARAGLPATVTLYTFRHQLATDLLAAGVPDAHVAEILGHQGTTTLHRVYSHLRDRHAELTASLSRVRGAVLLPECTQEI